MHRVIGIHVSRVISCNTAESGRPIVFRIRKVRAFTLNCAFHRGLPGMQDVQSKFFEDYLAGFRFTGEAWAVEEGTPVLPPEPLLRITAPLPEAQFVETALLAHIMFQTSVASRAARSIRTLQNSARYPVSFTRALEASIDRLSQSGRSG